MIDPDDKNKFGADVEIWREALSHLRYLSDEVWKRFQFFLWLELGLLILALALSRHGKITPLIFSLTGLFVALVARYILKRNRIYYLQMLAKKSLLEDELGFYGTKFSGTETDLAFPWRLTPEVVLEIKKDFDGWVKKSVRAKGTIALWQFVIYEVSIGVYIGVLISMLLRIFKNL